MREKRRSDAQTAARMSCRCISVSLYPRPTDSRLETSRGCVPVLRLHQQVRVTIGCMRAFFLPSYTAIQVAAAIAATAPATAAAVAGRPLLLLRDSSRSLPLVFTLSFFFSRLRFPSSRAMTDSMRVNSSCRVNSPSCDREDYASRSFVSSISRGEQAHRFSLSDSLTASASRQPRKPSHSRVYQQLLARRGILSHFLVDNKHTPDPHRRETSVSGSVVYVSQPLVCIHIPRSGDDGREREDDDRQDNATDRLLMLKSRLLIPPQGARVSG